MTQAYLFQSELVVDQAAFTAFSPLFASPFADDFLDDIQAADAIPTNEDDLNNQTVLSAEVEDQMALAREQYQKLLLYVGFAWPDSEPKLKVFGNNLYHPLYLFDSDHEIMHKPNGPDLDENVSSNHSIVVELEKPYTLFGNNGKARLLVFLNSEKSGTYFEAVTKNDLNFDSSGLRKDGSSKYGICLNFEQDINENIGVFLRAGMNDSKTESWMFTEIDQSLSGGTLIDGTIWNRVNDKIGLAFSLNGLSEEHKEFLKKGGYGFIIGDGKLNYGIETNLEAFYKIYLTNYIQLSFFYQYVNNPAYNRDRGQVDIYSLRTHIEF